VCAPLASGGAPVDSKHHLAEGVAARGRPHRHPSWRRARGWRAPGRPVRPSARSWRRRWWQRSPVVTRLRPAP